MPLLPVTEARPVSRDAWFLLPALLFFAVALGGCNTCFTFTSNSSTGTLKINVANPPPSCTLSRANAAVQVAMQTAQACDACSSPGRIEQVFLSLRGIALHPGVIADDSSPDWQELAPQLAEQPIQLDLMTRPAGSDAQQPLGEPVFVPAGEYRLVRLRLVSNQPAPDERPPEKNSCGSAGFNCVVKADGGVQPLVLSGAAPEFRITSDRITGGFLLVSPDSRAELTVEFEPLWSLSASPDGAVRLLPALAARAHLTPRP